MKILIVRLFPYEININNYNVQEIGLAKALVRKGHKCDIVFYTKGLEREEEIEVEDKSIKIYWVKGKNILKNGWYGNKIIELSKNYDIVQSSEYDQIYNLKLLKKIGSKLIIYHGPYFEKFNKKYNLKCKLFDLIFLNKKYKKVSFMTKSLLATDFLKEKGFENVFTVGVGLDKDKFQNDTNRNKIIKEDTKKILYIGKIEERRNIIFLVDLLKELKKDIQGVKLFLIGNGETKYTRKVFEHAKQNGVFENITYFKSIKQEKIRKIYENSDVFVLPTSYEIFGMVLLESMYFGIPVVTTLNGGSSTLIDNMEDGIICPLLDVQQWKDSIKKLIEDEEFYKKISQNEIEKIKEYTWDALVEKFVEVYNFNLIRK